MAATDTAVACCCTCPPICTRPSLQRIYGTAWESPDQLAAYQQLKEEAARRDHRKLGQELDLFSIQDSAGEVAGGECIYQEAAQPGGRPILNCLRGRGPQSAASTLVLYRKTKEPAAWSAMQHAAAQTSLMACVAGFCSMHALPIGSSACCQVP